MSSLQDRRTSTIVSADAASPVETIERRVLESQIRATGLGTRVARILARWHAARLRRRRYHQSLRALQVLSDRTLGDIGLNRSMIYSAANDVADRAA